MGPGRAGAGGNAGGGAAPTLLVLVRPAGSPVLADELGAQRGGRLAALLGARARAATDAAAAALPGAVVQTAPQPAAGDVPGQLAAAVDAAWPDPGAGPLLVLWPDLPRWRDGELAAALADLDDGCDLVLGPVFDGGFYLLGLARPLPALFALEAGAWERPDAMPLALAVAVRGGIEVGLLRAERALRTSDDAAAARADPLLDAELRGVLG